MKFSPLAGGVWGGVDEVSPEPSGPENPGLLRFARKGAACAGLFFANVLATINIVMPAQADIPFGFLKEKQKNGISAFAERAALLNEDALASEAKQSRNIRTNVAHNGSGSRISTARMRSPLVRDDEIYIGSTVSNNCPAQAARPASEGVKKTKLDSGFTLRVPRNDEIYIGGTVSNNCPAQAARPASEGIIFMAEGHWAIEAPRANASEAKRADARARRLRA